MRVDDEFDRELRQYEGHTALQAHERPDRFLAELGTAQGYAGSAEEWTSKDARERALRTAPFAGQLELASNLSPTFKEHLRERFGRKFRARRFDEEGFGELYNKEYEYTRLAFRFLAQGEWPSLDERGLNYGMLNQIPEEDRTAFVGILAELARDPELRKRLPKDSVFRKSLEAVIRGGRRSRTAYQTLKGDLLGLDPDPVNRHNRFMRLVEEIRRGFDPISGEGLASKGYYGALTMAPDMVVSATLGFGVGGLAARGAGGVVARVLPQMAYWYGRIAPDAYDDFLRDGFTEHQARWAAAATGATEAALEMILQPVRTILPGVARKGAREAGRTAIKSYLRRVGFDYGREFSEELFQAVSREGTRASLAYLDRKPRAGEDVTGLVARFPGTKEPWSIHSGKGDLLTLRRAADVFEGRLAEERVVARKAVNIDRIDLAAHIGQQIDQLPETAAALAFLMGPGRAVGLARQQWAMRNVESYLGPRQRAEAAMPSAERAAAAALQEQTRAQQERGAAPPDGGMREPEDAFQDEGQVPAGEGRPGVPGRGPGEVEEKAPPVLNDREQAFWTRWVERADQPQVVRISGHHYNVGPEPTEGQPTSSLGHSGEEFVIRFEDGRQVTTHNLWSNGEIPQPYREMLADNAVFLKPEGYAEGAAPRPSVIGDRGQYGFTGMESDAEVAETMDPYVDRLARYLGRDAAEQHRPWLRALERAVAARAEVAEAPEAVTEDVLDELFPIQPEVEEQAEENQRALLEELVNERWNAVRPSKARPRVGEEPTPEEAPPAEEERPLAPGREAVPGAPEGEAVGVAAERVAKQPWEMTLGQFQDAVAAGIVKPTAQAATLDPREQHRYKIVQAQAAGESIPAEVLAEYPDLVPEKPPEPEMRHGVLGVPVPATAVPRGAAPFAAAAPETPAGRQLLKRIADDTKRKRPMIGPRTIQETLGKTLHTRTRVGRLLVSKKYPATYLRMPHMIFSKAGHWPLNWHELGHGLSTYLGVFRPGWWNGIKDILETMTQLEGSNASLQTHEEGLGEMLRRYTLDYGSIPDAWRVKFEAALEDADPKMMAALRDTHRAYMAHLARPIEQWLMVLDNDKGVPPSPAARADDAINQWLYQVVGASPVLHRLRKAEFHGIAGDTMADKFVRPWFVTPFAVLRELFSKNYRAKLKEARAFRDSITDKPEDMQAAHTLLMHIPSETERILRHPEVDRPGIRGYALDARGFLALPEEERAKLSAAGIAIPDSEEGWLYFDTVCPLQVEADLGEDWDLFCTWGQRRVALHRYEQAGEERQKALAEGKPESQVQRLARQEFPELYHMPTTALQAWVDKTQQEHPDWIEKFDQLNYFMDRLLLLGVLAGEFTVDEYLAMTGKWEIYWPLPRQVEDRPAGAAGGGPNVDSGVRRAWGSALPYMPLKEAIELRVRAGMKAWYQNQAQQATVLYGQKLAQDKRAPFHLRVAMGRLAMAIPTEPRRAATVTPEENKRMLADGINRLTAQQLGVGLDQLPEGAAMKPSDIDLELPGVPVFRMGRPRTKFVIGPFFPGRGREYYVIGSRSIYDMLAMTKNAADWWQRLMRVFQEYVLPFRRMATRNPGFPVWNMLARDPTLASFMGRSLKEGLPYCNLAVGLWEDLTQRKFTGSEFATLTAALEQTSRSAHRTILNSFKAMLREGIAHTPDWDSLRAWQKVGIYGAKGVAALAKPLDVLFFFPHYASAWSEGVPRKGGYRLAKRADLRHPRAQREADYLTGPFVHHPGSADIAAFFRAAWPLNPKVQIWWAQTERITDPDPRVRAMFMFTKIGMIGAHAAVMAAASFLGYWAFYDDEERKEALEQERERPDDDRLRYWIPFGKVRLPFEYGVLGAIQSFCYNTVMGRLIDDPIKGKDMAIGMLTRANEVPGLADMLPPYVTLGVELWANYSFWWDDEITPTYLQADYPYDPGKQARTSTPEVYKAIGRGLRVSPEKVRYAVRGLFADQMNQFITFADRVGSDRPIEGPQDWPFIGRLFPRERRGWSSDSVQKMLDLEDRYQELDRQMQDFEKGEYPPEFKEVRKRWWALEEAHGAMMRVQRIWADVKRERDKPKPNYERIREWEREMTREARKFFKRREKQRAED